MLFRSKIVRFTLKTCRIKLNLIQTDYLPSLSEQKEIAAVLSACDEKIAVSEKEAALHDELFRALLDELISGRVSTHPLIGSAI